MRMIDGKPVVDADQSVVIQITQQDCERASKKNPAMCAAALALKRTTGCDECRVHIGCTYLRFGKKWLRYATPASLRAEIISFDRGGGFYPGDFRLYPMPASNRLKPIRQKVGGKRKAMVAGYADSTPSAKSRSDRLLKLLQQEAATNETARPETKRMPRVQRSLQAEQRVFHRIKGVRERANMQT
jgi:hypothetical protein